MLIGWRCSSDVSQHGGRGRADSSSEEIQSEDYLCVLCDIHHRAQNFGIHEIPCPVDLLRDDFVQHVKQQMLSAALKFSRYFVNNRGFFLMALPSVVIQTLEQFGDGLLRRPKGRLDRRSPLASL